MSNINRIVLVYLIVFGIFMLATAEHAVAHGSMETPVSRIYNCFLEGPENPKSAACTAAVEEGGKQALYDWNGVNQGSANDMHRDVVPDGKLCSGGNELFKGMDLARDDWHTTPIAPDGSGNFEFVFIATAPHSTKYFKFYVTREGYNPLEPLEWSDLEDSPFCTVESVTLENGRYRMNCPFPQGKSGKHVIYAIWQRDDSPEAFYTCMDVSFTDGAPVTWRSLGQLRAHQDLSAGDKVTFRLFDPQSADAETHTVELQEGQTGAGEWPFYLAEEVNANSSAVTIGVLASDGSISPVMSSQDNNVYVASDLEYTFQVDIEMADNGGGDTGSGDETCDCGDPGGGPGPAGEYDFAYPDGIGGYGPGTVVLGTDGSLYECRPYPYSGWCNQSEAYYAPGTGLAWQDAWLLVE